MGEKLERYVADNYVRMHQEKLFLGDTWTQHLPMFQQLVIAPEQRRILDFGCGPQGGLQQIYQSVIPYDPYIAAYANNPWREQFDVFFSCDTLEHLTLEGLSELLERLHRHETLQILVVAVATRPANKRFPNGTNVHLVIKPPDWWHGLFVGALGTQFEVTRAVADLERGDFVLGMKRKESS